MSRNFIQEQMLLNPDETTGRIKVGKLVGLLDNHPYKEALAEAFDIETIKDEYIIIDYVDTVYNKIKKILTKYRRFNIVAQTKSIDVYEKTIDGNDEIVFKFEEYIEDDVVENGLEAISIYGSKNSFLDEYEMTKYANNLFRIRQPQLANYNVQFFKRLAEESDEHNKERSYRLVEDADNTYVRGIVSTQRYHEYGVDFAFVAAMIILHENMKRNKGLEYEIRYAAINESKLEIMVDEKYTRDAGAFGTVASAIKIETNDLGNGALKFTNIIKVLQKRGKGFYLMPRTDSTFDNGSLSISHTTKPKNVFAALNDMDSILNTSQQFIDELNGIKSIKTPDELRTKILFKLKNRRSPFKNIKELTDIFNRKIDNEINKFSKLLEMCNKAEELNLEFDLKDKLRYIISDIILYNKTF
tara:strand:+ start:1006 stop:2247 length:1242 start_codon:yes stop_codon:yes gene_type:complete